MPASAELFVTPRLRARRIGAADVDDLLGVYGDRDAMRWVDDGEPLDRSGCVGWVVVTQRNYATRGYGMTALEDRRTGRVVGFCGLVHPGGQVEPELKYALARPYWGQGLATEAARGMLDWGARTFGLQRVIATAAAENEASLRVLRKSGMELLETRCEEDDSLMLVFVWERRPCASSGS